MDEYVIVRCRDAGVHAGTLKNIVGRQVELHDARRIWEWNGAFTCSEISQDGVDMENSRLAKTVPKIILLEACEVITCSEKARKCLTENE